MRFKIKKYLFTSQHYTGLYMEIQYMIHAPFSLTDLQTKPFDYWALGHIHERAELATTPPIIYPGNTQGRHRNEQGEKGCYIVEMTPTNTLYNFIPLQSMQFIEHHLDVT